MKAMILAAGRGIRMKPLTDHLPKPLVRVGRETLIERHIRKLADAKFEAVVINTAHYGSKIVNTLGDGSRYGISITYSDEGDQALETGGGIANALPLLGDKPFLVVSADVYSEIPYQSDFSLNNSLLHLIMVDNPPHHPDGDFSANELNLADSTQRYTYSGVGYYHPSIFTYEHRVYPLIETIQMAIADKSISASVFTGAWFDVGTGGRLHAANKYAVAKNNFRSDY